MGSDRDLEVSRLREREALDKAQRIQGQCRSQAVLMTRYYSSKLGEQGAMLKEALETGTSPELESKVERFAKSVKWIDAVTEPKALDVAISSEISKLREENRRLSAAVDDAKKIAVKQGVKVFKDVTGSEQRVTELTAEVECLRDALKVAKARCLELENAPNQSSSAPNAEVAALKLEVAGLRESLENSGGDGVKSLLMTMDKQKADHKAAVKKLKGKVKDLEQTADREKEELMTAMEKEVEALINEERKKFEKEKQKLRLQISDDGNNVPPPPPPSALPEKALKAVKRALDKVKPEFRECRSLAKQQVQEMPRLFKTMTDQVITKLQSVTADYGELERRYQRELQERRRLHNLVQELRGNIRVFCRVRPPTESEKDRDDFAKVVSFPNDGDVKIDTGRKTKVWSFDRVFDFSTSQAAVYTEITDLVTSVLDGFNVCIFAYGQTGSGKTWTMTGPSTDRGCNLRALRELFTKSKARSKEKDIKDSISVSVIEVYNEQIRDLLQAQQKKKLEVRRGEFGNYVPDLTTVTVEGDDEVLELMAISDEARSQTATQMNEQSSRSHMLMSVVVESRNLRDPSKSTRGQLHLVDLAGSERVDKSGAKGQALKEAQNINKSLSALGDVIAARAQGASHIPFRNSTLTHLLQDSLSHDSKTLMFCCISPVLYNADESICTLNFASRVGSVELGKASKTSLATSSPRPRK